MTRASACTTLIMALLLAASTAGAGERYPATGEIERFDAAIDRLLAPGAEVFRLSEERFRWSEGPVWVPGDEYLLFSDVPENTIWKWSETNGLTVFLQPATLADDAPRDPRDPGTNGLVLAPEGHVIAADHGSRSLIEIDLATGEKRKLAGMFDGQRFNSPNDLVISRVRWPGTVFFTDPPYGLEGQDDSSLKELSFNGIYRLDPSGTVHLLDDSLARPNGIALSPDERTLYVANSWKNHAVWMAYDLDGQGNVAGPGRIFASAQDWADAGDKGLPDGIAVDGEGHLWATGPGGVYVIDPQGQILGRVRTGRPVANCTFGGPGGNTLYMTSAAVLARVQTRATGLVFQPGKPAGAME